VIWGDPHVNVFDHSKLQRHGRGSDIIFLDTGDYWLLKSTDISIQGRYVSGPRGGAASMGAVAVGGPFLAGHVLVVEAMSGQVTWDGEAILQDMPSDFEAPGLVSANFHAGDARAEMRLKHTPLRTLDAQLPHGVRLTVNRWRDHIDAMITASPQPGGQDGHCGNFNGDGGDDTVQAIQQRDSHQVRADQGLFGESPAPSSDHHQRSLSDCADEVRRRAEERCSIAVSQAGGKATEDFMKSCVFDVCFAGEEFAEQAASMQKQMIARAIDVVAVHPHMTFTLPSMEEGQIRWTENPSLCWRVDGVSAGDDLVGELQARVVLGHCDEDFPASMRWRVPFGGLGEIQWAADPSMCVDVPGGGAVSGTPLQLWKCHGGHPNMQFAIPAAGGAGAIRWASHADLCADVAKGSTAQGTAIQLWKCGSDEANAGA